MITQLKCYAIATPAIATPTPKNKFPEVAQAEAFTCLKLLICKTTTEVVQNALFSK